MASFALLSKPAVTTVTLFYEFFCSLEPAIIIGVSHQFPHTVKIFCVALLILAHLEPCFYISNETHAPPLHTSLALEHCPLTALTPYMPIYSQLKVLCTLQMLYLINIYADVASWMEPSSERIISIIALVIACVTFN